MKGVARSGKIEFEQAVFIPDGMIVDVVIQEPGDTWVESAEVGLLASLRKGYYLGGAPYLDRDAFYGEAGRPK